MASLLCRRLTVLSAALLIAGFAPYQDLTTNEASLVNHISTDSLKEHLTYIASDALEGRGSPSKGLDMAADYIAAHFKKCGLEPLGDDGYFQTTEITRRGVTGKVRNVIGVLRGSDPKLKDTYIIVTAHYDHLGKKLSGEGDLIYNGANDDGSGTVSVMELADAFAHAAEKPKRSIIFMTFWGEELGLRGSRYYGQHPVVPVTNTIADINLEQIGRTDDTEGPRVKEASMTGFDYTDIGTIFAAAGKKIGIAVTKHPQFSDAFFARSDNQAMAFLGVPSCTLCTAYEYPDYHRVGDEVDKIDFGNMAQIDKMVALGVWEMANSAQVPKWDESNPKTARYVTAWHASHP